MGNIKSDVSQIPQPISDITGQVSIYFVNTDNNNKPFSYIDRNDNSASSYSFALSFTSSDGSFSFNTSVFTGSYMVNWDLLTLSNLKKTAGNNVVAALFAFCWIIVSLLSWYFEDLHDKVTVGNLQAFYASASYIAIWVFAQKGYYGFFYFVLLIPAILNWWKLFYFVLRKIIDADDAGCKQIIESFM